MTLRIGSLFSGAAGLDLGVTSVLDARTVWVCEYDKDAAKVLAARFPDAPNLGDITKVDWHNLGGDANGSLGDIDVLTGGFP